MLETGFVVAGFAVVGFVVVGFVVVVVDVVIVVVVVDVVDVVVVDIVVVVIVVCSVVVGSVVVAMAVVSPRPQETGANSSKKASANISTFFIQSTSPFMIYDRKRECKQNGKFFLLFSCAPRNYAVK